MEQNLAPLHQEWLPQWRWLFGVCAEGTPPSSDTTHLNRPEHTFHLNYSRHLGWGRTVFNTQDYRGLPLHAHTVYTHLPNSLLNSQHSRIGKIVNSNYNGKVLNLSLTASTRFRHSKLSRQWSQHCLIIKVLWHVCLRSDFQILWVSISGSRSGSPAN